MRVCTCILVAVPSTSGVLTRGEPLSDVRALQYVFWNLGSIVNFVFAVIGIAATDSLYASNGLFPLDLIMIFMKLLMVQLVPLQVCVACSHRVSCFCFGCVLPSRTARRWCACPWRCRRWLPLSPVDPSRAGAASTLSTRRCGERWRREQRVQHTCIVCHSPVTTHVRTGMQIHH